MPELVVPRPLGLAANIIEASNLSGGRLEETHASDAALVRRVAEGDRDAFERIYEMHRARAYRLAYGVLLDSEDAREAVQEAFLKLHAHAARWEPHAALATWLHRVVLNHCLSLRRRLVRFVFSEPKTGTHRTPELAASLGQAVGIVEQTLRGLPPKQRAILTLFLDEELKPAEIAPLVDLTANATRVALHRALEKLRSDLAARGIDTAPSPDESISLREEEE